MTFEWKLVSLSSSNTTASKTLNQLEKDGWIIFQVLDTRVVVYRVIDEEV